MQNLTAVDIDHVGWEGEPCATEAVVSKCYRCVVLVQCTYFGMIQRNSRLRKSLWPIPCQPEYSSISPADVSSTSNYITRDILSLTVQDCLPERDLRDSIPKQYRIRGHLTIHCPALAQCAQPAKRALFRRASALRLFLLPVRIHYVQICQIT